MGKHIVTAKQRHGNDPLFPLVIALSGLSPLTKVWVDYYPHPRNTFAIKVNDSDIYNLVKEDVNYDPAITEILKVDLIINQESAISEGMPWIMDDVEERIQTA